MLVIRVFGKYIPIRITPSELEKDINTGLRIDVNGRYRNVFRANPLYILQRLVKAYNVVYELKHFKEQNKITMTLRINALNIYITVHGHSVRNAKMNIAYKLHKTYTNLIRNK